MKIWENCDTQKVPLTRVNRVSDLRCNGKTNLNQPAFPVWAAVTIRSSQYWTFTVVFLQLEEEYEVMRGKF